MDRIKCIRLDVYFVFDCRYSDIVVVSYNFDPNYDFVRLLNAVSIIESLALSLQGLYNPLPSFDARSVSYYREFKEADISDWESFNVYYDGTEEETTYSISQEV